MKIHNRLTIIFGAILVQMCIGTIYSWSLFNEPLMNKLGKTESEVVISFSIAVFIFALSTILSGRLQDKIGPRIVATIGGFLYGGGIILSAFSSNLLTLYITYGIIGGMGVGFAYVCPITTSLKWFPNKKGLITGVSVGAFGLGSLVFKFIIQGLLTSYGISHTFIYIGIIYLVLILLGAQFLVVPNNLKETNTLHTKNHYQVKEMLKTKSFYYIFSLYLLGCSSGLLVIGLAKDIGVDFVQLDPITASNAVVVIALFNASGRIIWASLTDKLNIFSVVLFMFLFTSLFMGILSFIPLNTFLYFFSLSGIALCFGGFLAVFPIITGRFYGLKNHGANYGVMYQAYGIAALLGPLINQIIGQLMTTFMISTFLSIIGLYLTHTFKKKMDS